jgi:transglutaminase-like putative cysteine protease
MPPGTLGASASPPTGDTVTATLSAEINLVVDEPAELVFSVAAAAGPEILTERLECRSKGVLVPIEESQGPVGARLHVVQAPVGPLTFSYATTLNGVAPVPEPNVGDQILYRRPSRFAESDRLGVVGQRAFGHLAGQELVNGIAGWVNENLYYVPGISMPSDGAVDAYLNQQGICRDFAHLVVALCRACGVPARLVSMYAPGLFPMDFHAVAEVCLEGRWQLVDATRLAPRQTMVRIATGRDASDTAFLSQHSGSTTFGGVLVSAWTDGLLPLDDPLLPVWS